MIYNVDASKGLYTYVDDTDFAGGWNTKDSNNADNVMPQTQTGSIISHTNCLLIWPSKLKTKMPVPTMATGNLKVLLYLMLFAKQFQCKPHHILPKYIFLHYIS